MTVLDLVDRIVKTMGSHLDPEVLGQASNEIREQRLSSAKARKILGWRPLFDLDQGLACTVAWYRKLLGEAKL
jgi:CDP-glucose 4,6-dehydratase